MSATPPGPLSGRTPTGPTPNGAVHPQIRRKKPPANPLVQPKRKLPPRPPPSSGASKPPTNGLPPPQQGRPTSLGPTSRSPSAQPPTVSGLRNLRLDDEDLSISGFSDANIAPGSYQDFALKTTKRELLEGLRFHVARFPPGKKVDPRKESEFTRPVRLHRRDPKAPPPGSTDFLKDRDQKAGEGDSKDAVENEELNRRKEERQKEREANLAQIAPSAETGQKRSNMPRKKTQQVFKTEWTEKDIERERTKYEETMPWHLEDFDNKNPYMASLEAGLSRLHVAFVVDQSGFFRMIPLEKWYKFNHKKTRNVLTLEEAEKEMKKKPKDPEFLQRKRDALFEKQRLDLQSRVNRGLFSLRQDDRSGGFGDDLGMEFEDDFADDEEGIHFAEKDEDAKFAEDRIKQDQLKANIFALKEEQEFDDEEKAERKQKEQLQRIGKGVTKALKTREKNYDLFSDSDENPYVTESESESSETERLKEEQKRQEEEKQRKEKEARDGDKSGASTKGTNTPSGRKEKHAGDPLKKSTTSKPLKRPGSPNLSDASGTDSSRKKPKRKHGLSSSQPTATSTPQPGSRPPSPPPSSDPSAARKSSMTTLHVDPAKLAQVPGQKKRPRPAGAGSDSEGAAFSDPAASDGGVKPKRVKINGPGSQSPTALSPEGSRAGSPVPAAGRATSPNGAAAAGAFPTVEEIARVIPQEGISTGGLIKLFRARIGGDNAGFIALVRKAGHFDKDTKLIRPKAA